MCLSCGYYCQLQGSEVRRVLRLKVTVVNFVTHLDFTTMVYAWRRAKRKLYVDFNLRQNETEQIKILMVSERIHSLQLRSISPIGLMEQAHNPLIKYNRFCVFVL